MSDERPRKHIWISNTAFTRITGVTKVCMDCGFGVERGQRLTKVEQVCPGKRTYAS